MHRVVENVKQYSVTLSAADLGVTLALVGAGTLVNLLDHVPAGYQAVMTRLRLLGTMTSATGTVVCDIGPTSDPDVCIDAIDIEGTVGDIDISAQGKIFDFTGAGEALTIQVTTATAAPTAVCGLRAEFELRKYASEDNA